MGHVAAVNERPAVDWRGRRTACRCERCAAHEAAGSQAPASAQPPRGLFAYDEAVRRLDGQPAQRAGLTSRWERAVSTWTEVLMSQPVRELQVTPWDALLLSVRLAAGRVEWTDQQLTAQVREQDGDMNHPAVLRWLRESRLERSLLAKSAKAAVDAGVAERIVRQVELETQLLLRVIGRTIDALELSQDQRIRALSVVQQELLAIESSDLVEEPPPQ